MGRTGNKSGIYYSCSKQQSTVPVEVLLATLWGGLYCTKADPALTMTDASILHFGPGRCHRPT
jgi:hypothetical protein